MMNLNNLLRTKGLFSNLIVLQLFISLMLALITLMAYWQVRNNEFINLDDNLYVTDNPHVQNGITFTGALWAFTSIHNGQWHPLTWLSHMLDCNLYGLNPNGHHMTNLLIHMGNTVLLFIVFFRMTGGLWQSVFIAALFAVHPLHVESVAWVSERRDVLYAFFWMLTMWAYLRYAEVLKPKRFLFVVLFFVLASMSKPMAVTLPFILLLIDYWPLRRFKFHGTNCEEYQEFTPSPHRARQNLSISRLISEKISLFILAALLSLFTIFANSKVGALSAFARLPLKVRVENAVVSYVKYVVKMFWPNRLAVLYPHPVHLPSFEVALAAMSFLVAAVLVFLAGRKRPYVIVGCLWYTVTLLPTAGLLQSGVQAMADRFTYIPFIGLSIIVIFSTTDYLVRYRYGKLVLAISGVLVLIILMFFTIVQVGRWKNSVTLFRHTLRVTANNYVIHNNLGVTLARQGNDQEAFEHYTKALEINPRYSDAHYNLAALLARRGMDQEATAHFIETLRIEPERVGAHNDLGVILAKQGKFQEAIAHLAKCVIIDPDYAEAYFNIGFILVQQGRSKEAIPYFNEALRIKPKDDKIHNNLAAALAAAGRTEEAITHYNQALQINPGNSDAHYNLASLLTFQGKDQEAMLHYYKVLQINPSDAQAHYELANILFRQKRNQEAAAHLAQVVKINPNYGEAHLTLGMVYLTMGKKDLAFAQYAILKAINKNLAKTLYQKISGQND